MTIQLTFLCSPKIYYQPLSLNPIPVFVDNYISEMELADYCRRMGLFVDQVKD